jgi:NAD(P)-dependent dehydrogenase (short-subunit alcohol dehydrogenase family)
VNQHWFDLTGRVALVTGGGAAGGIGHAIALAFGTYGADVFVADRDEAGAEQTAEEIRALGRKAVGGRYDIGNPADIEAMFAAFDAEFPHIDILLNGVADGVRKRPEDITLAEWQRVIGTILGGTFLCSQEAGKRMIRRGKGGSIINIGSIAGALALGRGNFVYSVGKAGIHHFTRELAVEWSPHQIRVNAILPAQTASPGMRSLLASETPMATWFKEQTLRGIPLGRFGEPEDMAKAAVFLASDAASFITGHCLPVDGGNLALNAGGSRVWPGEE